MQGKIASVTPGQTGTGKPVFNVRLEGDEREFNAWPEAGKVLQIGETYDIEYASRQYGSKTYYTIGKVTPLAAPPIPSAPLPPPAALAPAVDARQAERRSIERQQALIQAVAMLKDDFPAEGVDATQIVLETARRFASFLAGE